MPRTAPSSPPKRLLRCPRCDARKFRVPSDLALHILSKHGHATLPDNADDAHSVTQTSPEHADVVEIDHLLLAAGKKPAVSQTPAELAAPKTNTGSNKQRKRKRSWTSSSSGETEDDGLERKRLVREELKEDTYAHVSGRTTARHGESTGPKAGDVFVDRCREGRISLVPIQPQPSTMLNFANGLF